MPRERKRRQDQPATLEMTPMIDVVFQLLIFFIVTLRQEDILSHLDVNRPAPESKPPPQQPQELLTILVYKEGLVLQGRRISLRDLDRQLTRISKFSKSISIIIKCTSDSPHLYLMQVLDICSKAGMKNLNVFSM